MRKISSRKLLVKLFVGDMMVQLFGKAFHYARAANIIVPSIMLLAYLLTDSDYPKIAGNDYIGLGVLAISIFFGFAYFRIKPVSWEELSNDQKFQYGNFSTVKLTYNQIIERNKIIDDIKNRQETVRFHNVGWFLINIIAVIVTVLLLLL